MNRFGFCKQEGPVFRIRDLNSPWRSVLHLGQRQMVGKSYQWEDDPEFVRRHPALMSNLVHSLGAKAGAFYSQITESVELDPQTQVCRYLHRLADERRTRVVNPGVSQSELALVLGLHRSTVCRIIRTLRDRGVLGHFTRCSLEILDREALAELCNPSEGGK